MTDNKIINGLWGCYEGETLSNMERLCIYSFCAHGHDFHLWTYADLPNVPADTAPGKVIVRDGNEILPKSKMRVYRNANTMALFADWFRWELMRQCGGWYMDMDVVCLRPFDFSREIVFGTETALLFQAHVMKFPKGHFLAAEMTESCASPTRLMPWDKGRRKTRKILKFMQFWRNPHISQKRGYVGGPPGFTAAVNHYGLQAHAAPQWYFDPIHYDLYPQMMDDSLHRRKMLTPILESSFGIHLYRSCWTTGGCGTDGDYHPNSLYEVLKRRYLPELQDKK